MGRSPPLLRDRDLFIGLEQADTPAFRVPPIAKPMLDQRPRDHRMRTISAVGGVAQS
jgi:hypothetical protein